MWKSDLGCGVGVDVGGVGKCWGRCEKVCWGGKGRCGEKCWGRCEKVCWGVGEVRGDLGRGVGGVL